MPEIIQDVSWILDSSSVEQPDEKLSCSSSNLIPKALPAGTHCFSSSHPTFLNLFPKDNIHHMSLVVGKYLYSVGRFGEIYESFLPRISFFRLRFRDAGIDFCWTNLKQGTCMLGLLHTEQK